MFEYEEFWADGHLIVYEEFGVAGKWAYQIETWSVDRFMVSGGRGSFDDSRDAIIQGRKNLFAILKIRFEGNSKWLR